MVGGFAKANGGGKGDTLTREDEGRLTGAVAAAKRRRMAAKGMLNVGEAAATQRRRMAGKGGRDG